MLHHGPEGFDRDFSNPDCAAGIESRRRKSKRGATMQHFSQPHGCDSMGRKNSDSSFAAQVFKRRISVTQSGIIVWFPLLTVLVFGFCMGCHPKATEESTSASLQTTPQPIPTPVYVNSINMKMMRIPEGEFLMGSPRSESCRLNDEGPQVLIRFEKPFLMAATEITQRQYITVVGENPSGFNECGDDCPVEGVQWYMAIKFCRLLSERENLQSCYSYDEVGTVCDFSANGYRLPTIAEWEYACRAGSVGPFAGGGNLDDCFGSSSSLELLAWYTKNAGEKTHPVARKQPNSWGLFDMHGNVWEWCWDRYSNTNYATYKRDGYRPSAAGEPIELRGGSWSAAAGGCRSARRLSEWPSRRMTILGFRVVRSTVDPPDLSVPVTPIATVTVTP